MADDQSYTVPLDSMSEDQRTRLEQVRDLGQDPEEFWPYILEGDEPYPEEPEGES